MIIVTQSISSVLGGGGSEQRIILLNVRLEKFPLLLCCEKVLRNQSKYPSGGGGPGATKLIFSKKSSYLLCPLAGSIGRALLRRTDCPV